MSEQRTPTRLTGGVDTKRAGTPDSRPACSISLPADRDPAEDFWRGRCVDCAHPEHPLRTCHEIVGAEGGDPSNGPAYCRCSIDYDSGAMEGLIDHWARWIVQQPRRTDWACRECVDADVRGQDNLVIPGFQCIWHQATARIAPTLGAG